MAWCQKCKTEYRDGYTRCNDCDLELVENLLEEEVVEESLEEHNNALINKFMNDPPEFLTTAVDVIDAELIESFLGSNNIPVLKKYRESGGYLTILMGNTNLGIDMYVPAKLFEEAKRLLEAKPELNFGQEQGQDQGQEFETENEDTGIYEAEINETEDNEEKVNEVKHEGFWKRIFK